MLTTNTLMNAVEAALKRLYPGEPVYYDELPKDFRRPSFMSIWTRSRCSEKRGG